MLPRRARNLLMLAGLLPFAMASSAAATWSIVMADFQTREVGVGTVTCLSNFDLLAIVPVVVVGQGSAAVQAAGDFQGTRRPIIFEQLMLGTSPADILDLLEDISGHQSRQYGIVDVNAEAVTFTGNSTSQWAGGVIGIDGNFAYAIQGNILAGGCVVPAIEQAMLNTDGDMAAKLMAGMEAARAAGGDGRCSCSPANPTGCGCPPAAFNKSGHCGTMVIARLGDTDDSLCNANGCADGDYFMKFNVAFQGGGDPDPVEQLQDLFDQWRDDLVGRPDAVRTTVEFDPPTIPPNGVATTCMRITHLDWNSDPIDVLIQSINIQHASGSAGLSTIGAVTDNGDGTHCVELTAGLKTGIDRFVVTIDDGIRPVVLMPNPALEYFGLGDLDGDGTVNPADLAALLGQWGPCPSPPAVCTGDLNGDGFVNAADLAILLGNWG